MAMPPRHIAIAGTAGCLLGSAIDGAWGWVVGILLAVILHLPVDWLFNEYWHRTAKDNLDFVLILGPVFIFCFTMEVVVWGWMGLWMMLAALLPDIIDDGIIVSINYFRIDWRIEHGLNPLSPVSELFPCHPYCDWQLDWWGPEETKRVTMEWESISASFVAAMLLAWTILK